MSFTIEKIPDEPIVVATMHEDYDLQNEIAHSDKAVLDIVNGGDGPYVLISVFNVEFSFEELLVGASMVGRGEESLWHHPNIKQVLFVTNDESLKIAAVGMKSDMFGNLNINVFGSLEQALAHARSS